MPARCHHGSAASLLVHRDLISGTATGTAKGGNLIGTDVSHWCRSWRIAASHAGRCNRAPRLGWRHQSANHQHCAAAEWLTDDLDTPTEGAPVSVAPH